MILTLLTAFAVSSSGAAPATSTSGATLASRQALAQQRAAPPPRAAPAATPGAPAKVPLVAMALKAGGAFPSFMSQLKTGPNAQLEVTFSLLGGMLEVGPLFGYARPPASHSAPDGRVGEYSWELTQEILSLGAVGRLYFLRGLGLSAYAGAGPRYDLLRSTVTGTGAGSDLGSNTQTDSAMGYFVLAGGELRLGPGSALLELQLSGGGVTGLISGSVGTTAPAALVGYRLRFL